MDGGGPIVTADDDQTVPASFRDVIGHHLRIAQDASFHVIRQGALDGDIKHGWYTLLCILHDRPGLTPGELSRCCGRDRSTLTGTLKELAAAGLIARRRKSNDRRSFTVAAVSASELTELTETRCWVEEIALRRSMAAATAKWKETLVVLCHRLIRTERSASSDGYAENLVWEEVHRGFHRALLSMCGSSPLRTFCDQLADQLYRYRYRQISVRKIYPRRDIDAEHQAILAAIVRDDADAAVLALQAHYRATAEVILADLPSALQSSGGQRSR